MGFAVRSDETVDAERSVIGLVAEIATVGEIAIALQALVYPVPDGSANDAGIGIDHIPIFLQITTGITHGVGIFAHHKGFVADFLRLAT